VALMSTELVKRSEYCYINQSEIPSLTVVIDKRLQWLSCNLCCASSYS